MPDITCPVCHTVNPSTRTFCLKCASDLHAVVADPSAPPPPPKVVVPIQPLIIGGGVALAAIALIALLVIALGGSPAASISPSGGASAAPSVLSSGGASSSPATNATPTAPTATQPPATEPPPTQAGEPTPDITPVPPPTIISFKGPKTVNCADQSYSGFITLTWLIDNAESTELSIDGTGLYKAYPGAQGSDEVPFSCGNGQHTYTLTTVGGEGPAATKTLTIVEDSGV